MAESTPKRTFWTRLKQAAYTRLVLQNRTLGARYPFREPAVLLLSYPRSGSSWLGQLLGYSPQLAYLREPVNQPYHATFPGRAVESVFDPLANADDRRKYERFADDAFRGIPPRGPFGTIAHLPDFALRGRAGKRLLIKEVNPLAAAFYRDRYAPQLLLLLRHPAAVADSFLRAGWLKSDYEQFGYEYGARLAVAWKSCGNESLVLYEEVASRPREELLALFRRLEVAPPDDYDGLIRRYCDHGGQVGNMYEIRRSSANQVTKWRQSLTADVVSAIRRGYERSSLPYYRNESEWAM